MLLLDLGQAQIFDVVEFFTFQKGETHQDLVTFQSPAVHGYSIMRLKIGRFRTRMNQVDIVILERGEVMSDPNPRAAPLFHVTFVTLSSPPVSSHCPTFQGACSHANSKSWLPTQIEQTQVVVCKRPGRPPFFAKQLAAGWPCQVDFLLGSQHGVMGTNHPPSESL